jgi:hypothetical protein
VFELKHQVRVKDPCCDGQRFSFAERYVLAHMAGDVIDEFATIDCFSP